MRYDFSWLDTGILYAQIHGYITASNSHFLNRQFVFYISSSPAAKVHCLVNDSFIRDIEPGLLDLWHITTFLSHPKLGFVLSIGYGNPFLNFLSKTLTRLNGVRYNRYPSIDAAREFLHQQQIESPRTFTP